MRTSILGIFLILISQISLANSLSLASGTESDPISGLTLLLDSNHTEYKAEPISPDSVDVDTAPIHLKSSMCMATAIYHEARGEPKIGKIAVGYVIKNRYESNRFPDDVCKVVQQKSRGVCQFSWFCQIGMKPIPEKFKDEYLSLATSILRGKVKDPTDGAQFFHATSLGNIWKKRVKVIIGAHKFF